MVIANILRTVLAFLLLLGLGLGYLFFLRGRADPHPILWILAALTAFGTVIASHALILLADFLTTDAVDKKVHERSGSGTWLFAYFGEIRDSLYVFAWLQPFFSQKPFPRPLRSQLDKLPVLLLHGYHCNRGMWHPLVNFLRQNPVSEGRILYAPNMEPAFGSIDRYADSIHERLKKIHSKTGKRSVLIGHSMGGLAARAYLRAHGNELVAAVITLGTPHQGTYLANFGHGKNTQQMRLSSEWLAQLANDELKRRLPPFEVIISLHDNIVSPRALQTIPNASTQIIEGLGHMSIALDRDVWRLIENQLRVWDTAL